RRADFGLADVLGVHGSGEAVGNSGKPQTSWETYASHTYLRLHPEVRGQVDGPLKGDEPAVHTPRHAVLGGFEETDILGFGGRLEQVTVDADAAVPLTYIPAFPIYPPEFSWMREPDSALPFSRPRPPAGKHRALGRPGPHSAESGGSGAG
ncbi:MAG: Tat pathway signal protein, partial [Chloroflexi bacterium]